MSRAANMPKKSRAVTGVGSIGLLCRNGHKIKHRDFYKQEYCPQCRRIATRKRHKDRGMEMVGRFSMKIGTNEI